MSFKTIFSAALAALLFAVPAWAEGVEAHDAYAISSGAGAMTGGAYMVIHNHGGPADRLIDVRSDVAVRVQLHTHMESADGVMQMRHVEEGFALPTDGEIVLERGGHHIMLMGLTAPLEQGAVFSITLVFEQAGEVPVDVTVDLERMAGEHSH